MITLSQGFADPSRTDRRFFQNRLRKLEQEGTIERVQVPHPSNRKTTNSTLCYIRLVNPDNPIPTETDEGPSGLQEEGSRFPFTNRTSLNCKSIDGDIGGLKVNVTLHRQMFDLLESAGTRGMTLSVGVTQVYLTFQLTEMNTVEQEISTALSDFDRRTLEHLLGRLDRHHPPANLADLHVAQTMETYGKERRYPYFTVPAY